MPTAQQIIRSGRKKIKRRTKSPALQFIFIKLKESGSVFNPEFTLAYLDSVGNSKDCFNIKELDLINSQMEEQEKILKDYFIRAEKIRSQEQNNIDFGVFILFKMLKIISQELQKTREFYSIVFVNQYFVDQDFVDQDEDQVNKYTSLPSSEKFLSVLFSKTSLMITLYGITILVFPEQIVITQYLNYFFSLLNLKILIANSLNICFSNKSTKKKLIEMFYLVNKVVFNLLLLTTLNLLFLFVFEVIKFEKNLILIEKNINLYQKKSINIEKQKWSTRKKFYFYLSIALVMLITKKCIFSVESKENSEDLKENQLSNISDQSGTDPEEESAFSRTMRLLGCEAALANDPLMASLPYEERMRLISEYQQIKKEYPDTELYTSLIAALLLVLSILSIGYLTYRFDKSLLENYNYPRPKRTPEMERLEVLAAIREAQSRRPGPFERR